jgi:UDP-glucose 4,6-dehydratase
MASNVRVGTRYEPRNILITGGAGFIGSHVVKYFLRHHKYHIVVLDKFDYCANARNLEVDGIGELQGRLTLEKGDVCERECVERVMSRHGIDTILHFAALTHVDKSFNNSLAFTQNNIIGTHVLLDVAKVIPLATVSTTYFSRPAQGPRCQTHPPRQYGRGLR